MHSTKLRQPLEITTDEKTSPELSRGSTENVEPVVEPVGLWWIVIVHSCWKLSKICINFMLFLYRS